MFEALGYSVIHGNTDWVIGMAAREMQIDFVRSFFEGLS
jgi:hypothetical protein